MGPGSGGREEPDQTGPSLLPSLQDFQFVLKGIARLLSNPLLQTYLPNSTKKIQFHQELLVLFWKLCDFNKVAAAGGVTGPHHQGAAPPPCGAAAQARPGQGWTPGLGRLPAAPPSDPACLLPPASPRNSSSLC